MKMKKKYFTLRLLFMTSLILCTFYFTGCSRTDTKPDKIEETRICLNTVTTVTLYGTENYQLLDEAFSLISHYQDIFSRTQKNSEVYHINTTAQKKFSISPELQDVVNKGLFYGELTNGGFDISIAPVSSLWDFNSDTPSAPSKEKVNAALRHVDYQKLALTSNSLTKKDTSMGLELGGIAKGYIADKLKEFLLQRNISSAVINLGGNILCIGNKPDGSPFQIGIEKPFAEHNEMAATMEITDLAVVTSGIYERCFEENGRFYHHILDPGTGFPVDNNLISVTIVSKNSTDADALSTSCFILGLEKGMKLIDSLEDTYAVFITNDYQLHYSDGFLENIRITELS